MVDSGNGQAQSAKVSLKQKQIPISENTNQRRIRDVAQKSIACVAPFSDDCNHRKMWRLLI